MIKTGILWLVVFLQAHFFVMAQEPFSMESYLKTATKSQELELYQAQLEFLNNNKYNKPWLSRVELRVGSENADITMDEFRLRLSPSNPGEIKANKIYHSQHLKDVSLDYEVALNQALKQRYLLILQHYYLYNHYHILTEHNSGVTNLVSKLGSNPSSYDMGDFLTIESHISDLMLEIGKLKMELSEIEYHISMDINISDAIKWNENEMISVEGIKRFLTSGDQEEDNNIYVRKAEQNLLLNQQMHKVNIAESRSNIGYIQSSLDNNRGKDFYDHFGFQIGIRLPIFNEDKPDLMRDKFDLIEDKEEIKVAKTLVDRRSQHMLIKLNHLIQQHELLEERINKVSGIKFVMPIDKGINALDLIRQRRYINDLTEEKIKIRRDIHESFIEYLDIKGYLTSSPLINYLSSTFNSID